MAAVAQLSTELGTAARDPVEIHRVTGGNPFFVTEVLAAATERVPATVRDAVLARVARLTAAARRVLDVTALVGPRAELDLLETLFPDGVDALDEAIQRGMVRLDDQVVSFRHELSRIVLAEQVPAVQRLTWHRRILSALESRQEEARRAPRMAHHAEAAGDGEAVLRHAPVAAADAAALGAHREAADQYRRALRHAGALPPARRADLLAKLAYECYLTGRSDEALEVCEAELALRDPVEDPVRVGDTHRRISRLNWFRGRNDLAEEHGDRAVAVLEGIDCVERAMAYSNLAQLRMLDGDLPGTRVWAQRALELLDRLPADAASREVRVHVLNNLGTAEATAGDAGLGTDLLTDSLRLARADDLHEHAARAYTNLTSVAVVRHRGPDAAAAIAAGLEYCAERDLDAWSGYLEGWHALLLLDEGDAVAAAELAGRTLARPDVAAISRIVPLVVRARAWARAGHLGWAEPLGEAAALAMPTGEPAAHRAGRRGAL